MLLGKIGGGGGEVQQYWVTPKAKVKLFLAEIEKTNHKLSKEFYFIKISYVKAEFIELFGKKGGFLLQLKQL